MILFSHDDRERWLNLNFTEIYVLLNADEYETLQPRVQALNSNPAVRRGLFNITAVQRGKEVNRILPNSIKEMLTGFNVIVRLVDGIHGIYTYGVGMLNTLADDAVWSAEFERFAKDVCQKNIDQLSIIHSRRSPSAMFARKLMDVNNMRSQLFKQALDGSLIVDGDSSVVLRKEFRNMSSAECSLKVIQSAVDASLPDAISVTRNISPGNIRVCVCKEGKYIYFDFSNRKMTKRVRFSEVNQTFLYAAVLYATKTGKRFGPSDFSGMRDTRNDTILGNLPKNSTVDWMEMLYRDLMDVSNEDALKLGFKTLFRNMSNGGNNVAKSHLINSLAEQFTVFDGSALKKCILDLEEDEGEEKRYYKVGIDPEEIIWQIPPKE